MYEAKLAKIEEKIKKLSPNMDYFNEEELLIIGEEEYLKKLIINKIIENYKDYSVEYLEQLKLEERHIDLFPQNILCYYNILACEKEISTNLFTHNNLDEFLSYMDLYGISDLEKEMLKKQLDDYYRKGDLLSFDYYITNELLLEVIKYERYDFIYGLNPFNLIDCDIDRSILDKLYSKRNNFNERYPDVFSLVINEEAEFDKLSIYALLFKLRSSDNELTNKILHLIVDKIDKGESLDEDLTYVYLDSNIMSKINFFEEKNKIFKYFSAIEVNRDFLFSVNLNLNDIKEIFFQVLYKNYKSPEKKYDLLNDIINLFLNDKLYNGQKFNYIDDEEITKALLDTGMFFYIEYNLEFLSKYEEEIIANINNGKYDNLNIAIKFPLQSESSYKIYNEAFKRIQISEINIEDNLFVKFSKSFSDKSYNLLDDIFKSNPNIKIERNSMHLGLKNNLNIINILLKYNRMDALYNLFNPNDFLKIVISNEELLYEFKKDYVLFKNVFNHFRFIDTEECKELLYEFLDDTFLTKIIIDKINHQENAIEYYNQEFYNRARLSISKIYNIDIDKLDVIANLLGYNVINYLNNPNIMKLFDLSNEELLKISNLFPNIKYSIDNLKDAYDSLKQYEFSKKFTDKINIFSTFMHAIEDKNYDVLNSCIEELSKHLTNDLIEKTVSKYIKIKIDNNMTPIDFLNYLVYKIQSNENPTVFIDALHSLTDIYIKFLREEYRESYKDSIFDELKIKFEYKQKSIESEIVKKALAEAKYITFDWGEDGNLFDYLIQKFEKMGFDEALLNETISYYLYKKEPSIHSLDEIKKSIKLVIKNTKEKVIDFNSICFNNLFDDIMIYDKEAERRIDREYYLEEQKCDIFRILSEIDFDIFKSTVLNNSEVYESLLANMKKNKLHILPNELKPLLTNEYLSFSGDYQKLSDFMSVYATIYKQEKSRRESLNLDTSNIVFKLDEIFKKYDVYSAISSIYSLILTDKDANLIKENPGPNSAHKMSQKERLDTALELTKVLFQRTSVTVPPIVKNVDFKSQNGEEKSLLVTVGNFTNSCNLTHGERTGACMRIGGVGDTLFDFCLKNPNGFHIRFDNPKTGEYISRVSGFRNGNTVFLNELRYSCNKEKYSDEDVVESCKLIAEELIKESKNSSMPIDNVVIHKAYAMNTSSLPLINLQVDSVKEGLPHFYSDVNTSAIVLATSNNGQLVKLNFDKSKVPIYKPARDYPVESYNMNSDIISKINRVSAAKLYLSGVEKDKIKPIAFDSNIIYAVVANDWYIYVDENNVIHKDVINNDDRAIKEQEEWLEKIEMRGIGNAKNR